MIRIFDIETDGLLDKVTKIHCLSYWESGIYKSITDSKEIIELFNDKNIIWVGHNIIRYDFLVLKKLFDIIRPKFVIDTLPLSWYLYSNKKKHGLEEWGDDLGIKKPFISDWNNLTITEYINRCEIDVKINLKLWEKQKNYLYKLYPTNKELNPFLEYINFKMDCVAKQEQIGLKFNTDFCTSFLKELEEQKDKKVEELESVMPQVAVKKIKTYKNAITDSSGNTFTKGDLFFDNILQTGAKIEIEKKLFKIIDWENPNSNSNDQIKQWLYSLGWIPEHIKHVRDKIKNTIKKVPQIASKQGGGEICESIKKLFEKEPKLELLEGLTILSHRIGILKAFLSDNKEGRIYPSISGLTNTLRLKHKILVNLPAIYKKYGKEIRSCLINDDNCILVGSDMTNIEDRTKRHYIYKYDPKYVKDMNTPGYDAHTDLGVLAGLMTKNEESWYKEFEIKIKDTLYIPTKVELSIYSVLKGKRNKSKITNFSSTYKVGAETLARNAGILLREAKKLLKVFWERNRAILLVEKECRVIQIGMDKWLQNPISKFWYSLRAEKDRFSTLNQGTAAYLFDMWLKEIIELGIEINFQYHDEILFNCKLNEIDKTKQLINQATINVNNKIPLNVPIGCSIQLGQNYAECH